MSQNEATKSSNAAEPPATFATVRGHMARGSLWMVGMRFAIRGLGVISTLILVRLLTPDDFGVMAMATLVTGIFGLFDVSAQRLALIRIPDVTRAHYDTAWTIQVGMGLALAVAVLAAAPVAAALLDEPRCADVLRLLSLAMLIGGFENIATANFLKNFDFRRDFRLEVSKKLVSFVVTLALALIWRDYWALAFGILAGRLGAVALSYLALPYLPRFRVSRWRELWSFAFWSQIGATTWMVNMRLDQFVVSSFAPAPTVGVYAVANEVAVTPTFETTLPLGRALFPSYARLRHEPVELRKAFLAALSVIAAASASLSVGLAAVADDFAAVVLGPRWTHAADLIAWLALAGGLFALGNAPLGILQASGRARLYAMQNWGRIAILAPCLAATALATADAEAVAAARTVALLAFAPLAFAPLSGILGVRARQILGAVWRPLGAAGLMAAAVDVLQAAIEPGALRLAASVALGAMVFLASLLMLWGMAGRPGGVERLLLSLLRR
jgi:lipopolysaccharide exporter